MRSPRERSTSLSGSKEPPRAWVWVLPHELAKGDRVKYWNCSKEHVQTLTSTEVVLWGVQLRFVSGDTHVVRSDERVQAWRPVTVDMPCTVRVGSDLYAGKVEHVTPAGQKIVARGESFFKKANGSYQRRSKRLVLGYAEDYMDPHF